MVARITYAQQQAVLDHRGKGRTDRQIEKLVGLPSGTLSRPYTVDVSVQAEIVRRARSHAAFLKRQAVRDRVEAADRPILQGWRPSGDCIRSRPNERPARSLHRRQFRKPA